MILQTIEVEKPWGVDQLPHGFAATGGRRIGEIWFDRPGDQIGRASCRERVLASV